MWRRLSRDDRHKPVPVRRRISFWKETAYDPESLGAETRQACDLEGVGAGARPFPKFKDNIPDNNHTSLHFTIVKALIKDFLLNVRGT
ncbi:hypothetical protein BK139_15320 [Paenibacillus sp. FSL R5-0490]|uniref:hypothetical protein n=1 Tax=Bacillales TaxID=1385 RepID=UPI00096FF63E|nr:hypothetical protein [Paenibacillus sp. FSL R5-0490]OMF56341.1 hypothetical protein BK139_15320 [Paenibacillus sp. FSL R5-0490]